MRHFWFDYSKYHLGQEQFFPIRQAETDERQKQAEPLHDRGIQQPDANPFILDENFDDERHNSADSDKSAVDDQRGRK